MSSDESLSPIMTMRRVKKISCAASKSTPDQNKRRDIASKLSLKKQRIAKENSDSFRTLETPLNKKVSASFIFSSCKKKQLEISDSLPGHSILVGDSSDEEFINCDSFANIANNANQNSEIVDESLVEYSLIRKWLHNAEDSFSSVDESSDLEASIPDGEKIKNTTIVISSDDESINLETAHHKETLNTTGPKLADSLLNDDSFDSMCLIKSLRERLGNQEKSSCQDKERNFEPESFHRIPKPFQIGLPIALHISSSDDEASSSPERLPRQSFKARQEILSTNYKTPTVLSDSELEDVFVSLTINEPPAPIVKPKKLVKPRLKKKADCASVFRQPALKSERSFLASLSSEVSQEFRHSETIPFMKNFRKNRDELTTRLFQMFNKEIFNNHFHPDFSITWNSRLTRTAGYCRHFTKRESGITIFESRIELSVKVVDTPCRLRDTLIHELCHAATWIIDNCRGGHGPVWRKWANQALHTFPELPPITRCHNYEISYKFNYNCVNCTFSTGRHSKSIDIATHVCPMCMGKLQLSKEQPSRVGGNPEATPTAKTPRTPNAFALFVKDNYAAVKSSRTDLPHAAVMKLLGAKFAESKMKLV